MSITESNKNFQVEAIHDRVARPIIVIGAGEERFGEANFELHLP
jgi:hypothetical protein